MDRLLEAGKVASVMRRRESPRQIPPDTLRSLGPASPRGFQDPKPPRDLEEVAGFVAPHVRPVLQNRLESTSRFRTAPAYAGQEVRGRDEASRPMPFPKPPALTPPIAITMPAHVAQAPPSPLSHAAADTPSKRLMPILAWRTISRARQIRGRAPEVAAAALDSAPPVSRLAAAAKGRALRVSMSAGFRIPDWKLQAVRGGAPEIAGMVWPGVRELAPAGAAGAAGPAVSEVPVSRPPMCVPAAPPADFERRFQWPGILGITIHFLNTANGQRTAFVPFGSPDDFSAKERR